MKQTLITLYRMPGFGEQLAGVGMGIILGGYNDQRQREQEEELTNIHRRAQQHLMDYSQKIQMQNWHDTNYEAQMKHIENAGLNPGLLYGMGGAGGATMGSGTAPSAASGNAPRGGREAQELGQMGIQSALATAQMRLMEAQTNKTNVEATKIEGVDTQKAQTEIGKLAQETTNEKVKEGLLRIDTILQGISAEIAGQTKEAQIDIIRTKQLQVIEELEKQTRENMIGKSTQWAVIDMVKAELIGQYLKNTLTDTQTTNVKTDTALKGKEIQLTQQAWEQNIPKLIMAWREDGRQGIKTQLMQDANWRAMIGEDPGEKILNNMVDVIQSILLLKTITKQPPASGRLMDR